MNIFLKLRKILRIDVSEVCRKKERKKRKITVNERKTTKVGISVLQHDDRGVTQLCEVAQLSITFSSHAQDQVEYFFSSQQQIMVFTSLA